MNHTQRQSTSWFALERYHLGELPEGERRRVEEHLVSCESCALRSRFIEDDERARPLPPLPRIEPESNWALHRWVRLSPVLAVAAAVIIVLSVFFDGVPEPDAVIMFPSNQLNYKGGELALTTVRIRGGAVVENPDRYLSGDRFSLRVTAPGDEEFHWDVAVFQGDERFFPYDADQPLIAGNRVPIQGGFRLTGQERTTICLMVGDTLPSREEIMEEGIHALPEETVCTVLNEDKKHLTGQ
jgi:hypothetical protein